ncbi:solute carrier family 2, facilitated glucose transporter member 8-like [Ylistrum balloti]|uniref:solute carrier family 2, facilitated glucose transporter member 8-like n=1 Tax=Ylistrum balloti TaxID=509963 RepID=UPI002905EB67|nr:solute carrier family 2, facilitated glucose transporter member 8-like [Ylistrum balloti]
MESLESGSPRLTNSKYEGSPKRLYMAVAFTCLGTLSFGFTIGYSSPAIPDLEKAGLLDGKSQSAWFGSLLTVGAIFGGPFAGYCIERLGRKFTIILSSVIFATGGMIMAHAHSITPLFVGRFLVGWASGQTTVCAPVYIAEIATKSLRGFLGSCVQLSVTIGILMAYTCGMSLGWSKLAIVGTLPAFATVIAMFFLPETPRWLLMKNRRHSALNALGVIRGPHTAVEEECRDIEEGLDSQESFSFAEFQKPELLRPLSISLAIMAFQQFSGINAVMFYTVSIFNNAGFKKSAEATVIIGAVQVVATAVACVLMDRAGRRKLLIVAGSVMVFSCGLFGLYFMVPSQNMSWLAITSLVIYIIGFSLGWGPIPMLVMSEIFPARARGTASGLAAFTSWFTAFIITKEFTFLNDVFGQAGTFWIFGACCLFAVMFVNKHLPETKGKSLEDIELYFLGRSMIR